MSASETVVVPAGFYAGDKLSVPRRYELLKNKEDQNNAIVVFAAIVGFEFSCGGIVLLEVDEYVAGYVTSIRLCAYGLMASPNMRELEELKQKMYPVEVTSIQFDPNRISKTTYDGKHRVQALQVVVRAFVEQRKETPILKQSIASRTFSHARRPIYEEDVDEEPVSRHSVLLQRRATPVETTPKRMTLKERLRVARERFDNRNFINRTLDAIAGLEWKDVEKRVGQCADGADDQD